MYTYVYIKNKLINGLSEIKAVQVVQLWCDINIEKFRVFASYKILDKILLF